MGTAEKKSGLPVLRCTKFLAHTLVGHSLDLHAWIA
jgi:hypothetical protein